MTSIWFTGFEIAESTVYLDKLDVLNTDGTNLISSAR